MYYLFFEAVSTKQWPELLKFENLREFEYLDSRILLICFQLKYNNNIGVLMEFFFIYMTERNDSVFTKASNPFDSAPKSLIQHVQNYKQF